MNLVSIIVPIAIVVVLVGLIGVALFLVWTNRIDLKKLNFSKKNKPKSTKELEMNSVEFVDLKVE